MELVVRAVDATGKVIREEVTNDTHLLDWVRVFIVVHKAKVEITPHKED